jgi:phosphoribosylamine--glycine ligase
LIDFAKRNDIDITIVGPEAPLVIGVVDAFQAQGLSVFGPTQAASQLEGSKAFCKDFLDRNNIPTAFYGVFTEVEPAVKYVQKKGVPIVIKADGLAAGKGVIIANTQQEATDAINDMLEGNRFGKAGSRVVVEEFLSGEEASFIVMVDGKNILPMATSQDHKARDNGDKGPNTGGMGAYSPAPIVTDEIFQDVMDSVIRPTVDGMAAEGNAYTGFLYAGFIPMAERASHSIFAWSNFCCVANKHNCAKLDLRRIIIGCVSGSPKRQLYSNTLDLPLLSIIKPAYRNPV